MYNQSENYILKQRNYYLKFKKTSLWPRMARQRQWWLSRGWACHDGGNNLEKNILIKVAGMFRSFQICRNGVTFTYKPIISTMKLLFSRTFWFIFYILLQKKMINKRFLGYVNLQRYQLCRFLQDMVEGHMLDQMVLDCDYMFFKDVYFYGVFSYFSICKVV